MLFVPPKASQVVPLIVLDFENAKALANDLMSLEDTKLQLVQTFKRALPIGLKAEALRCYAESYWLAAINTIRPLVDTSEFEWACAIITSSVTEPSRRKPRIVPPERGSARPSLEPMTTTTLESGMSNATSYQKSQAWGELADTEMSAMDMDIASQSMLPAEPWTTWPLIEDSNDPYGRYSTFEEPLFSQNVPPETDASATFLSGLEDLSFATCNDFDASDILEAVQPELVPHNRQFSLMEEGTETLTGDCTEKGTEGKAVRQEVGQPSNSHGVFEQNPFDPFSNPSFVTREPLSHGLVGDEALFNLDDTGGT
ncbi:hypothetical protein GRF29_1g1938719 [Pseudopithomyces chartarum]|uniref:Uncharacterized protein n=1 Tax=Pseudopithomyces chartarum TaxID=1892770 RepID=A0AAN6RMU2_9PLEO|nr:hypothetical protein GRF29_1g1938719 [Pseudopithomyces chartarum]